VDHLGVRGDGVEQQRTMAFAGLPFETQKSAGPLLCKLEHLRSLRDRFRQFQLAGVDAFEVRLATRASGRSPIRRRSQGFKVNIFDPGFLQRAAERRL